MAGGGVTGGLGNSTSRTTGEILLGIFATALLIELTESILSST